MPRTQQNTEFNTFVRGLITEAGPLTFPDNASLVEQNFILNKDGSRNRRLGLDTELSGVFKASGTTFSTTPTVSLNVFTWNNVNSSANEDFAVVQTGSKLWFYDLNEQVLSGNAKNSGTAVDLGLSDSVKISVTSVQGDLYIAAGVQYVFVLSYDPTSDTISKITRRLSVRDLWGVQDSPLTEGNGLATRPATATLFHYYNLANQGWPVSMRCVDQESGESASNQDPVAYVKNVTGFYPSNADTVWLGKATTAKNPEAVDAFSPWFFETSPATASQSPQGKAIIDVFNRGADRQQYIEDQGLPTGGFSVPADQTLGGISAVASFAGRNFYAINETSTVDTDDRSPSLGSTIFYSATLSSKVDAFRCHAEADPTAEDVNDVVATDGGFISIPEAGSVISLIVRGEALSVICSNGIWEIYGGETGFSATNQDVYKVSNIGALSEGSIVEVESSVAYWSSGGIYLLQGNDITLRGQGSNITQDSIQSFFDDIPDKERVRGAYDPTARQIRWLYAEAGTPNDSQFDSELVYDLSLQAWYTNIFGIDGGSPKYTAGYIPLKSSYTVSLDEDVTVGGEVVTVGGIDVTIEYEGSQPNASSLKYLITSGDSFSFGEYNSTDFTDWGTEDAQALLITGYNTGGASSLDKKVTKITTHFRRTESGFTDEGDGNVGVENPSSCLMQAQWEWTNSAAAGRWGREFQAYRLPRFFIPDDAFDPFDYSFDVVSTKNKLRGKGRAVSLQFKSEPAKDCHIYGWSVDNTVEQKQ